MLKVKAPVGIRLSRGPLDLLLGAPADQHNTMRRHTAPLALDHPADTPLLLSRAPYRPEAQPQQSAHHSKPPVHAPWGGGQPPRAPSLALGTAGPISAA